MAFNYEDSIKQIFAKKRENKNYVLKLNSEETKEDEQNNNIIKNSKENIVDLNTFSDTELGSKSAELVKKFKNVKKKKISKKNYNLNFNKGDVDGKKMSFIHSSSREKNFSSRAHYKIDEHINEFLFEKLNNKKKKKNSSLTKKEKNSKLSDNKYERYNTENIKYEAIRDYTQYKPKNKNFLERMEFYSIKKQSEEEFLNIIVEKTKPKIKESDRIKIFNNLIEDSNRRIEAKNRIEFLNKNYKIKNELYEGNNKKSQIKFNEKEFLHNYQINIIDKLKKKEKELEILRKQKKEEEEKKERNILFEMRKRNRKASKKTIESISNRLYNYALTQRLKNKIQYSKSEIFNLKNNLEYKINHKRNLTSLITSISQNKNFNNKFISNNNNILNDNNNNIYNNLNNTNNNNTKTEENMTTNYNSSRNKTTVSLEMKKSSKLNNTYQTAERMVDAFFSIPKKKKTIN